MRDHIRREAGNFDAGWWLVPVVFATAALVAVATAEGEAPAATAAPQAMQPLAMPVPPLPSVQPEATPGEGSEHVQAF